MEIIGDDYSVKYDAETTTIYWQGIMRLDNTEYKTIEQLLKKVVALQPSKIILDLRKLDALNSSGTAILIRFLLNVGRKTTIPLIIQATLDIAWQKKSVKNFKKFVPKLQFEWE